MKYKIETKKYIEGNYIGMNSFASKSTQHYHHKKIPFNHKHPEHIIEIKKDLPKKVRLDTIHHEESEEYLMKNKHYPYHKAHKMALKYEKLNKPFPTKNIKSNLIKMGFLKR